MTRTGRLVAAALALATLAAGCDSTETTTTTVTVTTTAEPSDAGPPPRQRAEFGQIESLVRKGDRYELRLDPAWFLSGETANRAAAEDGVVEPGEPVPNDNYRLDEGHRLLTYLVPATAKVTVLTKSPNGFAPTPVTVAQLARLVAGKRVPGVTLYEPLDTGVWVTYEIDTVSSIEQQYQP